MLLEIMCVVIIALIYLVGRLKEIDFPAIAPTLRQMQYERLSPAEVFSYAISNREQFFSLTRMTESEINERFERLRLSPNCSFYLLSNQVIQSFENEIHEADLADMPRQTTEISTERAEQEWRGFEDHRVTIMNSLVQRILTTQISTVRVNPFTLWLPNNGDFFQIGGDGDFISLDNNTTFHFAQLRTDDVSEAAAKGKIKPKGKSVSVEEVIAKIDKHLDKGDV